MVLYKDMKKRRYLQCCIAMVCVLGGCKQEVAPTPTQTPQATPSSTTQSEITGLSSYHSFFTTSEPTNYSMGMQLSYDMQFADDSWQTYTMDGTLEVQDQNTAHAIQNINSNGIRSTIDGYYLNNRFYNNYNNVTYYEDMKFSDLESSYLMPLHPIELQEDKIQSYQENENTYTFVLNEKDALDLFFTQFDFAGLQQYQDATMTSNELIQRFDQNGHCMNQEANFELTVMVSGSPVKVNYHSSYGTLRQNQTQVVISDTLRKELDSYVHYEDIDVEAISDADVYSDTPEDTIEKTFKKRLVNRLKYEDQGDNTYKTTFNEGESYVVDFNLHQFSYRNRTSLYVYNWLGDTGVFGQSCTVDFKSGQHSEQCQEDTIQMIETVKLYFQMELYYCGLSLEELVEESQ